MGYFLVFYGMQDGQPLISSRIILAQVIGRVCFPQNQAALLCQFKNSLNPEECDDAIEEDFQDEEAFINYRDCLENNEFHFNVCQDEKEKLTEFIHSTKYRYL